MIFHVNIRKRIAACERLSYNLRGYENAIVSVNETMKNVCNIETFQAPLFCKEPHRTTRAAVYIKGEMFRGILISHLSTPDVAVIDVTGGKLNFVLISAYLPPDENYGKTLAELENAVRGIENNKKIFICTDTNSRSPLWNDKELNKRGEQLEQFVAANDLAILNSEDKITFTGAMGSSKIDLILSNDNGLDLKPTAEVAPDHTDSDHRMIRLKFDAKWNQKTGPFRGTTRIYRTNKANWPAFEKSLAESEHIISNTNFEPKNKKKADLAINNLNEYLKRACESSIPKLRHSGNRRENENDEIDTLSKLEDNLNNRLNRLNDTNKFEAALIQKELSEVGKLKNSAIAKQRKECMIKRFESADINEAYKIHKTFKAKLNRICPMTIEGPDGKMTRNSHETTQTLFEHCFPNKNHPKLQKRIANKDSRAPIRITESEVSSSINWMANNKAPGIDGFTPEIIKRALHKILSPITKLYNSLLEMQYFPDIWGEGFAIFIPKQNEVSNGRTKTVKDFRPITLLSVLGKVFERLIINRINKFLLSNDKLNPRQDGFSKQRSTIHTLHSFRNFILENAENDKSTVAIFLDISGAFDNACWQLIIESLQNRDCPTYLINLIISYFENRKITTNSHNSKIEKTPTQGCPQGSCCAPSLWTALIDNIFNIPEIKNKLNSKNFFTRAFADDICLAFAFENKIKHQINVTKLEREIGSTLDEIFSWGKENYLDFNVRKTKAMFFRSSPLARAPRIVMNGEKILLEQSVKYLGIHFDPDLTFTDHAEKTIGKCKKIFNIVRSYCGNTWGLNSELTRLIYKTIIVPVLTYGASIWFPAFQSARVSKTARTLQYYCTKSIVKAYSTASIVSTSLLSNTLPLELEIYLRAQVELSRISGAFHDGVFKQRLSAKENYKPKHSYREFFNLCRKEDNLTSIQDSHSFEFGNPNELTIEPKIRWADLPVGPEKIPITVLGDFRKVKVSYDLYAFTDGSSITDIGTGGSFVIKTKKNETIDTTMITVLPMNPFCTAFQSEMFSIHKCLEWIENQLEENKRILLCTDSLSALHKLQSRDCDNLLPFLINDSLKKLVLRNCTVDFVKIPAHQNVRLQEIENSSDEAFFIQGNIDADEWARMASKLSSDHENINPIFNFISLSTAKRHIKTQMKSAWLEKAFDYTFRDDRAELNSWIKNFIPDASHVNKKLLKACNFYTSQVMTGHGCFMSYFKRFNLAIGAKCVRCKDKTDSPEHVLFGCESKYTQILNLMKIYEPKDLKNVLKSDENIESFKALCKNIINDRNSLINSSKVLKETKSKRKPKKPGLAKAKMAPKKNDIAAQYEQNSKNQAKPEPRRPMVQIIVMKTNKSKTPLPKFSGNPLDKASLPCKSETEIKTAFVGKTRCKTSEIEKPTHLKTQRTIENEKSAEREGLRTNKQNITATSWLDDEHIYKFAQKIQAETKNFENLIMSWPVYDDNQQTAGFLKHYFNSGIKNILTITLVNGNHWVLGVINFEKKIIAVLDSRRKTEHAQTFRKLSMIADLALFGLGNANNLRGFKYFCSPNIPKQTNDDDCGVFTCRNIKNILEKNPSLFTIATGEYREEIVEILEGNTTIVEPTTHGSLPNLPVNRLRSSDYLEHIRSLIIAIERQEYSQLIRNLI